MEKELANGMIATYLDESKKLAADRWLVKFRCRIAMPLQQWMLDDLAATDPQTSFCREQFEGHLTHEIVMERNFIDATEKAQVMADMIERLDDTMLVYLSKETFVRQLFATKLTEFRQRYAQQGWDERPAEGAEIPEPADFSACFR